MPNDIIKTITDLGGKSYDLSNQDDQKNLINSSPITLFPAPKSAQTLIELGLPVTVFRFPDTTWDVESKDMTGKTGKKYTRSIFRLGRIIVTFNAKVDKAWASRQLLVSYPDLISIKEAMKPKDDNDFDTD